jgi:hypothetical protein
MLIKVQSQGSTVSQANTYFLLYPIYPAHPPPRPNRLRSLIANIALGSIMPNLAYIVVALGMKPKAGNQTQDRTVTSARFYH